MMSKIPGDFEKISEENLDMEILRVGLIAELDAINLYEQLAAMTKNDGIKEILLNIAKEEKTHVGEFQALLLKKDNPNNSGRKMPGMPRGPLVRLCQLRNTL